MGLTCDDRIEVRRGDTGNVKAMDPAIPLVIPPEASSAFVANMEDVLDVYHRSHDPDCPAMLYLTYPEMEGMVRS
jgi:hypothetical protein